jgi:hypothetical protein
MLSDEKFLELMEELRELLVNAKVERYNWFVNNSAVGHECLYAHQALLEFQKSNHRRLIEEKILSLAGEIFKLINADESLHGPNNVETTESKSI